VFLGKKRGKLTIPNAIVFALVRGWFFMKRRGVVSPVAAITRMRQAMWTGGLYFVSKNDIFAMC
jgi:hypothetical protein